MVPLYNSYIFLFETITKSKFEVPLMKVMAWKCIWHGYKVFSPQYFNISFFGTGTYTWSDHSQCFTSIVIFTIKNLDVWISHLHFCWVDCGLTEICVNSSCFYRYYRDFSICMIELVVSVFIDYCWYCQIAPFNQIINIIN